MEDLLHGQPGDAVIRTWALLYQTAVGVLGIGLAQLQRGRNRFYYWSMIGSGLLLLLPIFHYLIGRLAMLSHNSFVYRDYQAVTAPILLLAGWGRWLAYAVLFLGLLDLRNDRSDTPVVGATLPAHPSVSSDKKPIEPGKPEV